MTTNATSLPSTALLTGAAPLAKNAGIAARKVFRPSELLGGIAKYALNQVKRRLGLDRRWLPNGLIAYPTRMR